MHLLVSGAASPGEPDRGPGTAREKSSDPRPGSAGCVRGRSSLRYRQGPGGAGTLRGSGPACPRRSLACSRATCPGLEAAGKDEARLPVTPGAGRDGAAHRARLQTQQPQPGS